MIVCWFFFLNFEKKLKNIPFFLNFHSFVLTVEQFLAIPTISILTSNVAHRAQILHDQAIKT